jgi:hypothetical protein
MAKCISTASAITARKMSGATPGPTKIRLGGWSQTNAPARPKLAADAHLSVSFLSGWFLSRGYRYALVCPN